MERGGRPVYRLDFRRSLESGLCSSPGEERGLFSRTAAGDRASPVSCRLSSSVATDGKDGNGLKLEKIGQCFQVL